VFEHDSANNNAENITGLDFRNLLPGMKINKDPAAKNTGDYKMYVRMIVTLSDAAQWISISDKYDLCSLATPIGTEPIDHYVLEAGLMCNRDYTNWIRYDAPIYDSQADTLTYVYYYNTVLDPVSYTTPLFLSIDLPQRLDQDDMAFGADNRFTISVKADAIQSDNIFNNVTVPGTQNDAYKAFNGVAHWDAGTGYDD